MRTAAGMIGVLAAALFCCLTGTRAMALEIAQTDAVGGLRSLSIDGDLHPVQTEWRVHLAGWEKTVALGNWNVQDLKFGREGTQRHFSGRLPLPDGRHYRFEQWIGESAAGAVTLRLKVTAEDDVPIEGVFLSVQAPLSEYGGGRYVMGDATQPKDPAPAGTVPSSSSGPLPEAPASQPTFVAADVDRVRIDDARGDLQLQVTLQQPRYVQLQDLRKWNVSAYEMFIPVSGKTLAKGQAAEITATIRLTGKVDHSPVALRIDDSAAGFAFDGFGGNYCFALESPVTAYTLEHLPSAWARTEMKLGAWEPQNDDASADQTDAASLARNDQPGTDLRRAMETAQRLKRMGARQVISVWALPDWMVRDQGTGWTSGLKIKPQMWPELLESLGSYLQYMKQQYGVEPDLFSFNEADYGVNVLLDPQEQRQMILTVGAHFAKLGLKTKLLLGDVAAVWNGPGYMEPTLADPQAMQYVGAVAFHSWSGTTPQLYGAWHDAALRANRPLLVTEVGVDAHWQTVASRLHTYAYATQEMQMYLDLLLYAQPAGTLEWEFTGDYALLESGGQGANQRLVPTTRYTFLQQFIDYLPRETHILPSTTNNPKVRVVAMRGTHGGKRVYTLHIGNGGAGRDVSIGGLPEALRQLQMIRTTEGASCEPAGTVPVQNGTVTVQMPAQSMLTLTDMPVPARDGSPRP